MARAKVVAIPIPTGQVDPERIVESMMISKPERPEAATTEGQAVPVTTDEVGPEVVRGVTLQDIARWLSRRITRDRIITLLLGCISIGALFLVWYLGTKYRFEFYRSEEHTSELQSR